MARDLFSTPIADWEYADVDAFLETRIPENTTVEYKANHAENLTDTLVAFANGESPGLIFVGVSEKRPEKFPLDWPLLEPGKDQLAPVYSKAAAETIPLVHVEARDFRGAADGKSLVVVRVGPGPHPPYFGKGRGVKVRSGDQDVDADPRTLESLFARRIDQAAVRRSQNEALARRSGALAGTTPDPFVLSLRVAPLGPARIPFDSEASRSIRGFIARFLGSLGTGEKRASGYMEFGPLNGQERLWVLDDGAVDYVCVFDDLPSRREGAPVREIFEHGLGALRVAKAIQASLAGGSWPLYVGILFSGLRGRTMAWPRDQTPLTAVEPFNGWGYDEVHLSATDPSLPFLRTAVKSLAWRLGYDGHEEYLDRWGSSIDESTHFGAWPTGD